MHKQQHAHYILARYQNIQRVPWIIKIKMKKQKN